MNKDLKELFSSISRKKNLLTEYPHEYGVTTYPNSNIDQRRLHGFLLELEDLGKVERSKRVSCSIGGVDWIPTGKSK